MHYLDGRWPFRVSACLDLVPAGALGTTKVTTLDTIKRRFAGWEEVVVRAFEQDEAFRCLCRDYVACTAALARWQEGRSEEARLRTDEYSELLAELTSEIEARLGRHGSDDPVKTEAAGEPSDSGR